MQTQSEGIAFGKNDVQSTRRVQRLGESMLQSTEVKGSFRVQVLIIYLLGIGLIRDQSGDT